MAAKGIAMSESDYPTLTTLPGDIRDALRDNIDAGRKFVRLAPSHQREYLTWIEEAKKPDTRRRRIERMLEMILANP
jgi:uncharacterized protein YdeI (YjbR/CyaY-like superfamily)